MPYNDNQQPNTGSFVTTTSILDISRLYSVETSSQEFKELIARLYQVVNNISLVLNTKESAFYLLEEFNTSKIWFNTNSSNFDDLRSCFRKVVNVGALPAGITNTAHGLTPEDTWTFTYIGGAASKTTAPYIYYPLPFAGVAGNIQVTVDATNVSINNASGVTFDKAYIVLEYLKY